MASFKLRNSIVLIESIKDEGPKNESIFHEAKLKREAFNYRSVISHGTSCLAPSFVKSQRVFFLSLFFFHL